jgi:hypothetical protein
MASSESSYESFPEYQQPSKGGSKGLAVLLIIGLVLIVGGIIAAIIYVEDKKKKSPQQSTLAVSSSGTIIHAGGAGLPVNGYYATLGEGNDASFYGVQANAGAKSTEIKPNEPLLAQIRRERYHYRERLANRMNTNSYAYPNTNNWWPRSSYGAQIRLEPGAFPKVSTPFATAWSSEIRPCGPDNPAQYGGADNSGTIVQSFGRLTRQGQCYLGQAQCPLGQMSSGSRCIGIAARDYSGELIWPRSELTAPISQVANLADAQQQWEGEPITSGRTLI